MRIAHFLAVLMEGKLAARSVAGLRVGPLDL